MSENLTRTQAIANKICQQDQRLTQLEQKLSQVEEDNRQQNETLRRLLARERELRRKQSYFVLALAAGFAVIFAQQRFQQEDVDRWITNFEKIATVVVGLGVAGGAAGMLGSGRDKVDDD